MVIILNADDLNLIFMNIMKKMRNKMKIADEDVYLQNYHISVAHYPRVPNRVPNVCCDTDLLFIGLICKLSTIY